MKTKLTQVYLKEALHYDSETGIFTCNKRPLNHFKNSHVCNRWNSRFSNTKAGSINCESGYLIIMMDGKNYKSHRLAFLYMEGYLPENDVDHMDRNRLNNLWSNLREAARRCNMQNRNLSINNTSGVTGVYFVKRINRWGSNLCTNGKVKYIGFFDNFEDAVRARYQEEVNNPEWTCSIDSSALKYLQEKGEI